jgi:hypothetical protein
MASMEVLESRTPVEYVGGDCYTSFDEKGHLSMAQRQVIADRCNNNNQDRPCRFQKVSLFSWKMERTNRCATGVCRNPVHLGMKLMEESMHIVNIIPSSRTARTTGC